MVQIGDNGSMMKKVALTVLDLAILAWCLNLLYWTVRYGRRG